MEQFAVDSHRKASIAIKEGRFKSQIIPITVTDKEGNTNTVTIDEGVKYPVDITKMKALKSPFKKDGVITAALSSQVSDGSGAVLLASENACNKYGLKKELKLLLELQLVQIQY